MSSAITYVTVQQLCSFHHCDTIVIQEFIDHGICTVQREKEVVLIPATEVPRIERALRLYHDLGVNYPGIDIILRLLDRIEGQRKFDDL